MLLLYLNWLQDMFDKCDLLPTTVNTDKSRCLDFDMDSVMLWNRHRNGTYITLSLIAPERTEDIV